MTDETALRDLLFRALAWEDAHVSFDNAVDGTALELRGRQPPSVPYSPWQLIEHMRITQHDILDFCLNPDYEEMKWPDDYWPPALSPASPAAWDDSIRQFKADRQALQQLAVDPEVGLAGRIPHGSGQTYARELLLVADHSAYHVGQLVLVRRLLGDWK